MLFTVFRADSVEKINIWVATLRIGWNQHTQLQIIATILKKIVLQVVLPVFGVSSSRCCGFVWSLPSWYFLVILTLWLLYFRVNKKRHRSDCKVAQRVLCHRLLHVTMSGFLEARSLNVDITYLSVDLLISVFYILLPYVFGKPLNEYKAKMKCKLHIIRLNTACKDKTIAWKKNTLCFVFLFEKLQPDTLDMYNGLSQVDCIKPEGRIHQYTKELNSAWFHYKS